MSFPGDRLERLAATGGLRELPGHRAGADFWSNDYLGLATDYAGQAPPAALFPPAEAPPVGSRLISGDHAAYHELEARIAAFHGYPAALVFASGYLANLGLLAALGQRTDTFLYDELSHASCRDGLRLAAARSLHYAHNDAADLDRKLARARPDGQRFVLTESRFSMDGTVADLDRLAEVCAAYGARLIVDEAHGVGLFGRRGRGLVHARGLAQRVFATVVTYGKAPGYHGAAVLGSADLRRYLVNHCRPFIYTTAPPPDYWAGLARTYDRLEREQPTRAARLATVIAHWGRAVAAAGLSAHCPVQDGPIQLVHLAGNERVMAAEAALSAAALLVKGIRSPTVPAGRERLRVCLHAFNTAAEVDRLVAKLTELCR